MEWQHVVEIFGGPDAQAGRHGSGYLLAPNLALTARHVVQGPGDTELRLLEPDDQGFPGRVGAWQKTRVAWMSAQDDLALLAPADDAMAFRAVARAAVVGRLDGRAPVPVNALGFPQVLAAPAHSDMLHITAAVNAWSGARSDALLLAVNGIVPAKGDGWKGMSGAAVFAGDRLVGVVKAVPARLKDSALRATPAHLAFDDDQAAGLLRAAGVALAIELVDARYVQALPLAGNWGGLREQYARQVVETFCSVDFLGLAVTGAADRRKPALAAFTTRRLALWGGGPADTGR